VGTWLVPEPGSKKSLEFNDGHKCMDDMEREKLKDISRERNDT